MLRSVLCDEASRLADMETLRSAKNAPLRACPDEGRGDKLVCLLLAEQLHS